MKHIPSLKGLMFLLIVPFLLSGCWDAKEMEQMYYIHSMGFDYVDGEYQVYAKIINFAGVTGESGGGAGGTPQAQVGKGTGSTVTEAIHDLYTYTQRSIYFGHLSAIVLSVHALEKGVLESLDSIDRFNEIRDMIWVFGTNEPIGDVLTEFPILETSVIFSVLGDPTDTYTQSSIVTPIRSHRLRRELLEPGQTSRLPNVAISDSRWADKEEVRTNIGLNGVHFVQEEGWQGVLTGGDIMGIRWLQEETKRAPLTIEKDGKPAVTLIMSDPQVEIQTVQKNPTPQFKVQTTVQGMVIDIIQEMSEEQIKKEAEKAIEEELQLLFHKGLELNADAFQLSYHLYRVDPKLWHRLKEKNQLELHDESLSSIEVEVNVQHSFENKLRKR